MSNEERGLLQMIAQSPQPVAMSDCFLVLNPAEPGMDGNHPGHEAWAERQLAWHGVSAELWKKGLVHVVTQPTGVTPTSSNPRTPVTLHWHDAGSQRGIAAVPTRCRAPLPAGNGELVPL
ncbi:hypothetical protein J7F04_40380 [Streptomyces sp. ISL-24]|nr:hypothetical protein [Streptomyces sp. ISL-24]